MKKEIVLAQWSAFNRVLHWVNEQEDKMIDKHKLYEAVMGMRPLPWNEIKNTKTDKIHEVATGARRKPNRPADK